MGKPVAQASAEQGIEYTIYTFDYPDKGKTSDNKWEKQGTLHEMKEALDKAEELYKSGEYHKIEVKQKYFDKKKNRNIDMTLKILEKKKKREITALMVMVFAVLCGSIAFGVTYLLSQNG